MRGPRRFPAIGSLVSVEWVDITSSVNANLSDATPTKCTTTGHMVKKTNSFIVVATSIFDEPGAPEISGDFVSLPIGIILKTTRIKTAP